MSGPLDRLESLFAAALQEPPAERAGYLDQACADDPALRERVEDLLRAQGAAGSFLEPPAPPPLDTVDEVPVAERPGAVIGPYRLMEEIGEGGMGLVFVAEQQRPVRRKVALKVIKPGMDTRQVVARFEAERQALALMDHPNIAHVFDGGTTRSGRPYFVMELVKGVPITRYCDDHHLSVRQRLELFLDVCAAVQHAHQKGVIHRDLKPSNVMVTSHDGTPVVKVIDFGVAKAVGQQLTDKTLYTQLSQMIGTPLYMSPEQAGQSGLDVDTRTDVYALGVLLYELLTGMTPFDGERLRQAGFDEMRRILREEEPARPSTRISTLGLAANTVSANRQSEPRKLSRLVRGELDWVVMRALEKDRTRRYESASAFAQDVGRYLHDEPVQACPPSLGYRLRKVVRRHKGPVLAAALLLFVLVAGIVGTTWGMLRATDAEADARQEAGQKEIALREKDGAFQVAQASARDAQEQLLVALRNQARAERTSGRPGQRFKALEAIRRAARIRVTPELRTEAIAALVLPDVEVAREWNGWPDGTVALAFDADFQRFARLNRTGAVTVGRLSDNGEEVIAELPARGPLALHRVWMSPDGRFVATSHNRVAEGIAGGACVWRLDGREPALLLDVPEGMHGNALAFSRNGRQLAIGHAKGSVSVYDLTTGERVRRLANTATVVHLAFHPRASRLALGCQNGRVLLFDVDTGAELPALRHPPGVSFTYSVAWNPDGRRLAAGCNDRKIHIWDTETGAETMPAWVGNGGDGSEVAFNHAGDRLGSLDWSGLAQVWDVATGRVLLSAPGFIWHFSPTDRLHGFSVEGTRVKLWRLASGGELRVLRRRNADNLEQVYSPVVHADGHIVAASSGHVSHPDVFWLCFFDLSTGEELASVKMPGRYDGNRPCAFHKSIGWITSGWSGLMHWPIQSDVARADLLRVGPPKILTPGLESFCAHYAAASADAGVIAVPDGRFATVIHRGRPEGRLKLGPKYDLRTAAVSPDGRWVATCSHFSDGRSRSTRIWDADTGRLAHELSLVGSTGAQFSPDGRWLVTTQWGLINTQFWEVGTWQPGRRFEEGLVFSPDTHGRLVALSGRVFGVVRLVELDTGREVARLTGPEPTGYGACGFTPDGTRLIAQGADRRTLHVWDLRALRQRLKAMGLDWVWPEFAPAEPTALATERVKVEVLPGNPGLSREQKARRAIEQARGIVMAEPDNAEACNDLAWNYLTAPLALRDVKAALPLAEKAVRLAPGKALYHNTLGVAYYRAGRYREAVDVLSPNLDKQTDWALAFDLYFLAMSHHRLGETARARDYYQWAVRWPHTHKELSAEHLEELEVFRAEAAELLKVEVKKD